MYNIQESSMLTMNYAGMHLAGGESTIRTGMIREIIKGADNKDHYIVEVMVGGTVIPVNCRLLVKFGGPYDFEEVKLRPYKISGVNPPLDPLPYTDYSTRSGDLVVVAFLNGGTQEGVILGCLNHLSRPMELTEAQGYLSNYNSIETKITEADGYKVTFKGKLLNPLSLHIPGTPILPPQYDPVAGGSYFELNSGGNITLNDNMTQSLVIDKSGKTTTLKSGQVTLELAAAGFTLSAPKVTIDSKLSTEITTKTFALESQTTVKIKGLKIAIGSSSFELLDGLVKLIDALGTLIVTSPTGPCSPLQASPTWAQIIAIKTQLTVLKGSL